MSPSKSLWRIEKGALHLSQHAGQLEAWDATQRFVFVLAGTQSGKTSWGPWWLWREIQRTATAQGGNDYLAVTSSYDLFTLKMLPEMLSVFVHTLGAGRYHKSARVIELRDPTTGKFWARTPDDPMWGRIILRSAVAKGGLESATAKAAWLDECGQDEYTVETWEAVLRRLSLSRGRVLGTTTLYNLGWVKTEIYDPWLKGDPNIAVVQFSSPTNPQFDAAEYRDRKAKMPEWRFAMMYDGRFTKIAGSIYDCYDDTLGTGHVIPAFPLPLAWPRYVGLDFGATNTGLVWVAWDLERNRFIAYRESLTGGQTTGEHASNALGMHDAVSVAGWFGGSPSETQQRMDWRAAGVPVMQPYVSDVQGGIDRVYAFLKTRQLYVFETCYGLRQELNNYRRKLDAQGEPTLEIVDKNKYHRLDALRYVTPSLGLDPVSYGPSLYS